MHLTQPIDSPGKTGEDLITNKVTATSPVSPDKSIDYVMHALPTAESRIIYLRSPKTATPPAGPALPKNGCSNANDQPQ